MSHVAPHVLADLVAERLSDAQSTKVQAHLQDCASCRETHRRVQGAQAGMRDIASALAPELGWDHIGARIYWSTSSQRRSEQREAQRPPRRRLWIGAAALACAAGLVWGGVELSSSEREPNARPVQAMAEDVPVESVPEVAVQELEGLVTFAQGQVFVGAEALDLNTRFRAGDHLRSEDGRVAIQFGKDSAFRLAAHSELSLRRFDSEMIRLEVQGEIDIDITRRPPGQSFVVVAGGHEVVVKGTAFRVEYREGELGVSCTRGRVVVTDGADEVHVPAGQMFRVLAEAWQEQALRAMPLDSEALRALDTAMAMPMVSDWDGAMVGATEASWLEVDAELGQAVAVDGVHVADGSFAVRAELGTHEIAAIDASGKIGESEWIEVGTAERKRTQLRESSASGASRESARNLRKLELRKRLAGESRTTQCLKPLAKQGLVDGSYIVFEVGVHSTGSFDFLNVLDSNLSPVIQQCLRAAVEAEPLAQGASASFRLRLSF